MGEKTIEEVRPDGHHPANRIAVCCDEIEEVLDNMRISGQREELLALIDHDDHWPVVLNRAPRIEVMSAGASPLASPIALPRASIGSFPGT